jgi:hypothetical protein
MEAVQNLEFSREELLDVEGAERSEGDGGNRGGRPRPGDCGDFAGAWRPITGVEPGSGRPAGTASEAAVVPVEPDGQHNRR